VIVYLPQHKAASETFFQNVLPYAKPGAILIDCTTGDIGATRRLASQVQFLGLRFADAPFTGGLDDAEAGQLSFFVGAHAKDFSTIEAALAPMARSVRHAGDHGAGQASKVCTSLFLGATTVAMCEALTLVERLNVAPDAFLTFAADAMSHAHRAVHARLNAKDVAPGDTTVELLRDMCLAQDFAAKAGTAAPLGATAQEIFALLERLQGGAAGFAAVMDLLRGSGARAAPEGVGDRCEPRC
jgi:3-hydroxyisobutyrate dehydrogenase